LVLAGSLLTEEDMYEDAAEKFDFAFTHCLNDNLLKLNAPSIILNAILCHICRGALGDAYDDIEAYAEVDFAFACSRERRFLVVGCL
jgi:hypothetical protein